MAARVAGELDSEQSLLVEAHLAKCELCRVVLSEVARTEGSRPAANALGRYVLEEKVGEGGMGAVFAAFDPKLGRRVAVKILHEAQRDGAHREQRFLHERQILAGLEHPNIGRLLDAGETDDRRPYFVMEFVDGVPLDQYCEAHRLSTRARLALFEPICAAVNHAHQHLVVHRDLKPGNILVTKDGVPKLVDFGIAKLLQESTSLTATGMTPMTPAFASPEQVKREPIATTSDVYSLGVVLYELLCGVNPYGMAQDQIESLLVAIRETEPTAPSVAVAAATEGQVLSRESSRERLRRALEGDLDSIVLMALRKEPKDRYASPKALAEDLRAYLEGRPTAARKGTATYRLSKFARRHRTSVAAVIAAFIALVAGLVATAWQARVASRERDLALRRFAQVRTLARTMLFDYHDGIASLPGSTPMRERLVKDALAYLDSLAAEAGDDASLQRELAEAYLKVGDVQGNPFAASLGDTTHATASYLRARQIAEAVLKATPGDFDARKVVASSHEKVGAVLEVAGDLKSALQEYELARGIDDALATERPADLEQRFAVSNEDIAIGQVLIQLGKLSDAAGHLQTALEARERLAAQRPDARTRRGLAVAHAALGDVQREQHRASEAIGHYEQAEAVLEALSAAEPDSADFRRSLGAIWSRHVDLLVEQGDPKPAALIARKLIEVDAKLLAADPKNAVAQRDQIVAQSSLAHALHDTGDDAAALPALREALGIARALAKDDPSNVQTRRDLSQLYQQFAEVERGLGDLPASEQAYRDLLEVTTGLLKLDPNNEQDRMLLGEAHAGLATLHRQRGHLAEAIAANLLALAALEPLVAANPTSGRLRATLAGVNAAQGAVHAQRAEASKDPVVKRAGWIASRDSCQRAVDTFAALKVEGGLIGGHATRAAEANAALERATGALAKLDGH